MIVCGWQTLCLHSLVQWGWRRVEGLVEWNATIHANIPVGWPVRVYTVHGSGFERGGGGGGESGVALWALQALPPGQTKFNTLFGKS